jgi:uncharacterized integral membrane protein
VYIENMLKRYIIILIITVLVAIFAIQNVETVQIRLWFFKLDASLSLIIILMFAAGALLALALALFETDKRKQRISELEEKLKNSRKKENAADLFSSEKNSQT